MNISVQVSNNKIIAKQTSKANASFSWITPWIRLDCRSRADPLEWVMEAVNKIDDRWKNYWSCFW